MMIDKKTYNCDKHGIYTALPFIYRGKERKIKPPCPKCSDKSLKEKNIILDKNSEMKFIESIKKANIPLKFCRYNFHDFDSSVSSYADKNLKIIYTYYKKFYKMSKKGISMTLLGKPGTGKTHLSCTLLSRLLSDNKKVYYTTAFELLSHIKSTYKNSSFESQKQVMGQYSRYDLLTVDEIGAYQNTQKDLGLLFDIIDRRYRNNMPVVLISNLMKNDFRNYIGERAFDRLKEGGGPILAFDWKSYRS